MRWIIFLIAFAITSCSDANIYTNLGIYDPVKEVDIKIESVDVKKGERCNVLELLSGETKGLAITYEAKEDYIVLKELKNTEREKLIELVQYLARTGRLDSYLKTKIDEEKKDAATGVKMVAIDILSSLEKSIIPILDEIGEYDDRFSSESFEALFREIENMLSLYETVETEEDYIAVQLIIDLIAKVLNVFYEIIIDMPSALGEYTLETLSSGEVFTSEEALSAIEENLTNIVSILLDGLSEVDLVASPIDSFIDLSSIVEEIL